MNLHINMVPKSLPQKRLEISKTGTSLAVSVAAPQTSDLKAPGGSCVFADSKGLN